MELVKKKYKIERNGRQSYIKFIVLDNLVLKYLKVNYFKFIHNIRFHISITKSTIMNTILLALNLLYRIDSILKQKTWNFKDVRMK